MSVEGKLQQMGLELPEAPKPVAAYIPAKRVGDLVFVSGQIPLKDGKIVYTGKVGAERTQEEGYEAAKLCALNALAAVKALTGSLDAIEEIVQVRGSYPAICLACARNSGAKPGLALINRLSSDSSLNAALACVVAPCATAEAIELNTPLDSLLITRSCSCTSGLRLSTPPNISPVLGSNVAPLALAASTTDVTLPASWNEA